MIRMVTLNLEVTAYHRLQQPSSLLTALLFAGNYDMLRTASKDKFHQEVRMKNLPELFEVQRLALESGALMSTLSGSGSSFFSMVYADDAERLKRVLENSFGFFRIEIFDFDNDGLICNKN